MRNVLHDVRFGLRVLRGNPGFTLVAVLTLALGIAANTTVFGWVDGILLRPIPGARAPHELAILETVTSTGSYIDNSYPDYRDFRDRMKLISGLAGSFGTCLRLGEGEGGATVWAELVTGNFFDVLGVQPYRGRYFSAEESAEPPAVGRVAVISYRLWQNRFGSDAAVLGKTVRVNGRPLTVIGIAPPEFYGSVTGISNDLWAPLTAIDYLNRADPGMLANRQTRNQVGIARLQPGVTLEQARAEASAVARDLAASYPKSNVGMGAALMPVAESHTGAAQTLLRRPLHILLTVCGIVLLIACANVSNLLLARATARQKEFAIRLALGARRQRLAGQLFVENLMLAGAGAALGLLAMPWMAGSLVWLLPPVNAPVRFDAFISLRVLGWTTLVAVAAAMLSGMAPLACSLRPDLVETLKEGGRGERSGGRAHRLRGLLVAVEVALATVAITGAGLFFNSFQAARAMNPGFQTANVLVGRFTLADTGLPVEQQHQFCQRLRQRLEAAPGVTAATYADIAPLGFDKGPWQDIAVEGYVPARGEYMMVYRTLAAPGYFGLLGIPLLEGRDFTERDNSREAEHVMIVNQAFAKRYFGGANPLGRKVRAWGRWFRVIGEARDARYHNRAGGPEPYFYVPYQQTFSTGLNTMFFVRTAGDPSAAISTLRREAAAVDPAAPLMDVMPLAEHIGQSLYPLKVAATLLGALGALAAALAALGLYSVMTYAVSQRTHEVGIRMALGAQPRAVLGMVVRQGMALTAAGLAAGMFAAYAITRALAGSLMGAGEAKPATFAAAALLLAAVAVLASYVPARRATRVDPMDALRCE